MKFPHHIKYIKTAHWTQKEWLAYRMNGIGGSEISVLFGLNPYMSRLQLHLQKTGQWDLSKEDNFYSYRGKVSEDMIVQKYWRYYTDDPQSILLNAANPDFIPHKVINPKGYFVNEKYPHLFISPDRLIPIGHFNRITGEALKKYGVIEIKNTASAESRKYEAGLSPAFLSQIMMYLLVLELDYSEIMLLKDSTFPELLFFERNDSFCESIIETSLDFWKGVLKGRELLQLPQTEDVIHQLQMLEPGAENSQAYLDFVKDRYKGNENGYTMDGTHEQYETAQILLKLNGEKDKVEDKILAEEIKLKKFMLEENIEQLNFMGGTEYVRFKKDARNAMRFTNKVQLLKEGI